MLEVIRISNEVSVFASWIPKDGNCLVALLLSAIGTFIPTHATALVELEDVPWISSTDVVRNITIFARPFNGKLLVSSFRNFHVHIRLEICRFGFASFKFFSDFHNCKIVYQIYRILPLCTERYHRFLPVNLQVVNPCEILFHIRSVSSCAADLRRGLTLNDTSLSYAGEKEEIPLHTGECTNSHNTRSSGASEMETLHRFL